MRYFKIIVKRYWITIEIVLYKQGIIIIKDVDKFVYLRGTVSKEGGGTQDIHNRVVKARGVFMTLRKIWRTNISRRTRIRPNKPVLIYGCETWKVDKFKRDKSKTDVFLHVRYASRTESPTKK